MNFINLEDEHFRCHTMIGKKVTPDSIDTLCRSHYIDHRGIYICLDVKLVAFKRHLSYPIYKLSG